MSIPDNDSFLYMNEKELFHFIYMKANKEQISRTFLTDNPDLFKPYVCAFFDEAGRDYLGHLNQDEIRELIDRSCMKNILENDYQILKTHFPSLTESDYKQKVAFTKDQFKSF